MPLSGKPSRTLFTIESSSLPWSHSSSKRLGPTGPLSRVVPWQVAQVSVYFVAIGLPRPPPRPGGGAPGAPCPGGGPAGGCCGCCAVIDAARSTAVPSVKAHNGGIDFIKTLRLLRRGDSVRCAPPAEVEDGAGRKRILLRDEPADQCGELLDLDEPSPGDLREHVIDVRLRHLVEDPRLRHGGRHAIHGDVVAGELLAQG